MPGNVHEATVARIEPRARAVVEYVLRLPGPIDFRPGQFVSLEVGRDADDNPILRSYSIASSPGRAELSLILKLIPGGKASDWFAARKVGDVVRFTGPMGYFVLDAAHPGDVVFAATGTGITPVLAMLDQLIARNEPGRIHVYWGCRDRDDLFWTAHFEERAARVERLSLHVYLSGHTGVGWNGDRGRITGPVLELAPTLAQPTYYLVGNGAMITELKQGLVARGVDRKKQIRTEAFFD